MSDSSTFQNLISPRSRAPIILADDDDLENNNRESDQPDASQLLLQIQGSSQSHSPSPRNRLMISERSRSQNDDIYDNNGFTPVMIITSPSPRPDSRNSNGTKRGGSGHIVHQESNSSNTTTGSSNSSGVLFIQQGTSSSSVSSSSTKTLKATSETGRRGFRSPSRSSDYSYSYEEPSNSNPTGEFYNPNQPNQSLALASSASISTPTGRGQPVSILRSRGGQSMDSPAGDLMAGAGFAQQTRAEEESSAYRRRLESYRQAQHQQALLVARLQSKLLQYKQRCNDLESKLGHSMVRQEDLLYGSPIRESMPEYAGTPHGSGLSGLGHIGGSSGNTPLRVGFAGSANTPSAGGGHSGVVDLDDALWKLDQERVRNEHLIQLNRELRGELEETQKLNNALSTDLQKLSDDWDKLTRQMGDRENLWRAEEQAYSDYYASEHTKLLALWKKVAGMKRDFSEVKSATARDLAQLKNSLGRVANQVATGVITASVSTPNPQQEAEQTAFIAQLTHEITMAQNGQENLRKQIKDRDDRISSLESTLSDLDTKSNALEQELVRVSSQELSLLQNCLREIGKLLLSDFEQHGTEGEGHDLHLSSSPAIFIYDENGENPTVFAESIVSAVQAALNKRQLQIHSLQVSLNSSKEQSMVARGHVESLEQEVTKDEDKIRQLTESCEKLKDSLENIRIERDTAQRALDNLKNEKNILEQQRKALASELESTIKIKTSLSTNLIKCEKSLETSRDEIETLTGELDKTRDELASRLSQLKLEQDLSFKLRESLSSCGDDKEKNASENKNLKTSLNEVTSKYEDICFQFERSEDGLKKWKMDAEILIEKLRSATERSEGLEKEKKKWMDRARQLEDTKDTLESELTDARNDLASLRREMLESERIRTDLEGKIEREISRADGSENRRSILESQLESQRDEFIREMGIITERTEMLSEELNQARRELEETYQVLERVKADLSNAEKLHMEAIHVIESKEATIKNLSNALDKTRDEKNSLEELEQTLKIVLIDKDKRIETLDKQMAEMKNKATAEASQLKDKLNRTQNEMRAQKEKSDSEKASLESKFTKELAVIKTSSGSNEEKLKNESEEKIKSLRSELEGDKKVEVNKLNSEINSLRQQIDSMRVQYEEALLRAENDKQQGLLLAQQDQQGLSDKIRLLERELEDLKAEKDRIKRDCEQKCSHEKNSSAALRSEVIKIKNELENTKQDGLETLKQIEQHLVDVEREREGALMQVEELRNKLRSYEERESELRRDLADVNRKLKESENTGDHSKKEISELRRTLGEMGAEKEKTNSGLENLKDDLNRKESELGALKKDLNRTTTAMKNLERVKAELESEVGSMSIKMEAAAKDKSENTRAAEELAEHLNQAKTVIIKLDGEVVELKMKLEAESERRDEAEAQWHTTKKMFDEAEGQLGLTKGEEDRLAAKLADMEERYGARENQLLQMAEDNKMREKKLMEEKHNLNICLNSVQQQMEHLTNKLSTAENRLKLLSDEKGELEKMKKEAESKLSQISSGFKRLGLTSLGSMDNPEAARRAMATLQTQMASLQQDRDTVAAQLSATKDSLAAVEMSKVQLEDQLAALSRSLQTCRSEVKGKDSCVMNLEKDVALKNGEISRLADKVREYEDSVRSRDEVVRTLKSEKEAVREDYEKFRQKWEDGKTQNDSKLAKAEVNMRALEGDLNRMALVLQQKDGHIAALEEKCSGIHRNNSDLEERCASLTMTVEQLNISLEKSAQGEQDWKDKYHSVSRSASENSAQVNQTNERLRSLLREKAMLEQEKNNIGEKWEAASTALQDFKRQVQTLSEKNQKLRLEAEDLTRNAIDKQLKIALAESGKEDTKQLVGDKMELQRKVDSLMDKIRDLERENRELERLKDSVALKGVAGRSPMPLIRDNTFAVLEEENADLRRKLSKMEAEIRDMERRHSKHVGEVTQQVKQERDFELERARAAKLQAERLLEARESNYRQQIQRLEQQVGNLKEQLAEEIRRRQSFLSRSFRTGQEIRSLRQTLGDSLRNVSMDPSSVTMDTETRRLDNTLDLHKSGSQSSLLMSPQMRDPSPAAYKRDLSTSLSKH